MKAIKTTYRVIAILFMVFVISVSIYIWNNPRSVKAWHNEFWKAEIQRQQDYDVITQKNWKASVNYKNDKRHNR